MTFDELIRETSEYTDETITKVDNDYIEVDVINKIKSGLNQAYMKVCRLGIIKKSLEIINGYELDDSILEIEKILVDNVEVNYDIIDNKIIYWSDKPAILIYQYMPNELVNYADVPMFPNRVIEHKILCFYAAFHYYNIEPDAQASQWLSLWEEEFRNIKRRRFTQSQIKQTYTM